MTADRAEAVAAFESLGLTSYEAKMFIGLHALGIGTAREVAEVTDVPRSQVYSVAEDLEERGLIDIEQASPRRFRPIDLESAKRTLRDRFDREQERAFQFVEAVRDEATGREEQEAVWTIHGRDRILRRTISLIEDTAESVLLFIEGESILSEELVTTLSQAAREEVSVHIVSSLESVRAEFEEIPGVTTCSPPHSQPQDDGRLALFIDDDGILIAAIEPTGIETGIWSSGSVLARLLTHLIAMDGTEDPIERGPSRESGPNSKGRTKS